MVHISKESFHSPNMCLRDKATSTVPIRLSSQLLRVRRQIYHEAIAILYTENVFRVNELHVFRNDFLGNIGVCNAARLNSVTIEVRDNDEDPRVGRDPLGRVALVAQDMLVTFQEYPALRSIQNFSVKIATSNRHYIPFPPLGSPDAFLGTQVSLQMLRRTLALATLVHCGFCASHDLEEQCVKTSTGWLESTMSLAKLLPGVCGKQNHSVKLRTANASSQHASERAKAVQKHFANTQVHCTGNWNCCCWAQKRAVGWPGWPSLSEVSSEGWKLGDENGSEPEVWGWSWLERVEPYE